MKARIMRRINAFLAALLLLALILVFTCTGCAIDASATTEKRFTYTQENMGGNVYAWVITDTETGQQYLYITAGQGGGLTKLED